MILGTGGARHASFMRREQVGLTDEQFFELCSDNRELLFELTAQKELVIMTLPGAKTGRRNTVLSADLEIWARQDGTGITFRDPPTAPCSAARSLRPEAS